MRLIRAHGHARAMPDVTRHEFRRIRHMDGGTVWGVSPATLGRMRRRADSLDALMERYAAGHEDAFEPLYRALSPPLYRFCLRLTMRQAEADDLFQNTFLKLHRARATYVSGSNPLHWAYAIARSLYRSGMRYWNRRPEQLGSDGDITEREDIHIDAATTPEAEVVAEHMADVLSAELAKMSELNRTAYVLLKEEGLSVQDAAALLGTSADAVKQRAHRASERLRAALDVSGWVEYGSDSA